MDFLSKIMDNQYYTSLLVCGVLILSEVVLWKRQMHYNRNQDNRMDNSLLNRKYHLNEKKKIDLEYINKTISLWNIAAILVAGVIMCINLIAGVLTYTVLTVIVNLVVSARIAKKYENSK